MANSKSKEKLNHVSLDGNKGHRITKRAKETNDMKSKKIIHTKEKKTTRVAKTLAKSVLNLQTHKKLSTENKILEELCQ